MTRSPRPSQVYGPPGTPRPPRPATQPGRSARTRRPRWPLVIAAAVLAAAVIGVLVAPDQVGEGGIPPAVVDVVSEDQAIAALALYRAEAEARAALLVDRSLYTPPGPSVLVTAAETAAAEVRNRLAAARDLRDADPTVRSYWAAGEHDDLVERLERLVIAIREINLLAATHDSIYDGAGQVSLPAAAQELTSRYLTGTEDESAPMGAWGRALLAELDGADERPRAEAARAAADAWWRERAAALEPPALEPLRAYLGGLPESTVRGLEGHPLAGPGLAQLRTR
jgi:hypothetical protein